MYFIIGKDFNSYTLIGQTASISDGAIEACIVENYNLGDFTEILVMHKVAKIYKVSEIPKSYKLEQINEN